MRRQLALQRPQPLGFRMVLGDLAQRLQAVRDVLRLLAVIGLHELANDPRRFSS